MKMSKHLLVLLFSDAFRHIRVVPADRLQRARGGASGFGRESRGPSIRGRRCAAHEKKNAAAARVLSCEMQP
jgi:hypothetical protein